MISPYVRKLRLGAELRGMRAGAGLTAAQLGKRIGRSRADISRLENGHVIDQADVMKILDELGVDGERWTRVMTIAREASEDGWWRSLKTMGDRQARYADLEAGATAIREYEQTFLPGLLQIPEFVRARTEADATLQAMTAATIEGITTGNAGRQRMFRRPGGPELEVIVDEVAVRRPAAPPEVVKKQLYHLCTIVQGHPKITMRVLPVDARVIGFTVPRCAFSLYTYPDPGDPSLVIIDTVTNDLILSDPADVAPYDLLYERLRDASLPQADSLELLTAVAAELPEELPNAKECRNERCTVQRLAEVQLQRQQRKLRGDSGRRRLRRGSRHQAARAGSGAGIHRRGMARVARRDQGRPTRSAGRLGGWCDGPGQARRPVSAAPAISRESSGPSPGSTVRCSCHALVVQGVNPPRVFTRRLRVFTC